MADPFTWQDGERTIRFGRGTIATAEELLGTGYTLLTTERAGASAPALVGAGGAVRRAPPLVAAPGAAERVGPGDLDEIADERRGTVDGELRVARAGGRVVDVTK